MTPLRIAIPDDHQDCVRSLACFSKLSAHQVTVFNDTLHELGALAERLQNFDALVLTRERTAISAALLARLPQLRVISQTGKVAEHIDIAACSARGVALFDGRGSGAATAELTWALVLASRRHLVDEVHRLKSGQWQGHLGQQLSGQRLGIWGYGRIGRQVAHYGRAFGMRVWIWGRETSQTEARADGFEIAPSRQAFFAGSDVLSLHVRLNAQTRALVTADDLALMRPDALFVNTSRAELVADGALVAALNRGHPGFAAVDVYEAEPLLGAAHPLVRHPRALCTPHIGYVERDNYELYFGTAFDHLNAFASGQFQNLINPEILHDRPLTAPP